jgi:hypothetical protein
MADPKDWSPGDLSEAQVLKALKAGSCAEAVVKMGYGDLFGMEECRILDFKTGNLRPDRAAELVRLVAEYNDFKGDDVADALLGLHEAGLIEYVIFGRAGSPVLYILPNMKALDAAKEQVRQAMSALKAVEIDDDGPYLIRAWWD